jgi:hypothetical protein
LFQKFPRIEDFAVEGGDAHNAVDAEDAGRVSTIAKRELAGASAYCDGP